MGQVGGFAFAAFQNGVGMGRIAQVLVSVEDGCGQRRCSACFVMKRKMLADPYGRSLYQVACCIFGDVMHLFMPIVKARCTWEPICWRLRRKIICVNSDTFYSKTSREKKPSK
jgi:hypothetical protein